MLKLTVLVSVFLTIPAHATIEFKDCSEAMTRAIQDHLPRAGAMLKEWQETFARLKADDRYKTEHSRIRSAERIAKCAARKLEIIDYVCVSGQAYDAQTFPILGKKVKVNESFLANSDARQAGILIHEATHKCGTTDAAYFDGRGTPPRNAGMSGWDNIADTYEWWAENGVCVPGIDC